jgi:hypothetical protein
MNLKKMQEYIKRWDSLFDVNYSFFKTFSDFPNKDLFFKEKILNEPNQKLAEERLSKIEIVDAEWKKECEFNKTKEKLKKLKKERKTKLQETDWTQLADCELNQKSKIEYREYRRYLRRIPELYKRGQITELSVMSIEEWRENKPVYKD